MKKLLLVNIGMLISLSCRYIRTPIQNDTSVNKITNFRNTYTTDEKNKIDEIKENYLKLENCDNTDIFNKDPNTFLKILFKEVYGGEEKNIYSNCFLQKSKLQLSIKLVEEKCKKIEEKLKGKLFVYKKQLNKTIYSFLYITKYLFSLDKKGNVNTEVQKNKLKEQITATKGSIKKTNDFIKAVHANLQKNIYDYNDFADLNNSFLMKNYFIQNEKSGYKVDKNNIDLKRIGLQIISNIKNNKKDFGVITMTGPPGVGKTYLAKCIMNDLENNGYSKKYMYIDQSDKIKYKEGLLVVKRKCGESEEIKFNEISLLVWDDVAFTNPETVRKNQNLKQSHNDLYNLIKVLKYCKENNVKLYISSNNDNLKAYFKKCIDNKIISDKEEVALIKGFLSNKNNYLLKNLNLVGTRKGIINYFANNKIYHDTRSQKSKEILDKLIYTFIKDKSTHDINGGVVYVPINWFNGLINNNNNQKDSITINIDEKNEGEIDKIKNLSQGIKVIKCNDKNRYNITIPLKFLKKRIDVIDTSKKLYKDTYGNNIRLYGKDNPRLVSGTELITKGCVKDAELHYLANNLSYDKFHAMLKRTKNVYCRTLPELSRNNFDDKKLSLILFDKATSQYLKSSNKTRSINEQYAEIANNDYKIHYKNKDCMFIRLVKMFIKLIKKILPSNQARATVCNHVLDPFKTFVYGTRLYSDKNKNKNKGMSFLAGYFSRLKCSTIIFNDDQNIKNDSNLSLLYPGAKTRKRLPNLLATGKFMISSWCVVALVYSVLGSALASLLISLKMPRVPSFFVSSFLNLTLGISSLSFIDKYVINNIMPQVKCHLPNMFEIAIVMGITTPLVLIFSNLLSSFIPFVVSGSISAVLLLLSCTSMFFK